MLAQIIERGEVTRGWFGVEPQDVDGEIARALSLERPEGVLIRSVQRGGPADRAGVQVRDVVIDIDGRPTRNTPALLSRIAALPPGSSAKVTAGARRQAGGRRRRRRQAAEGVVDFVIPAQAGIQRFEPRHWVPACAGTTNC